MKYLFLALVTAILCQAQTTLASDSECQRAYSETIFQCAINLDFLSPDVRAGAQKACVQDAKLTKESCMAGTNVCLNTCQTQYNSQVVFCETSYDPSICDGSSACEQIIISQRTDCITQAVDTLNACNAACPQ